MWSWLGEARTVAQRHIISIKGFAGTASVRRPPSRASGGQPCGSFSPLANRYFFLTSHTLENNLLLGVNVMRDRKSTRLNSSHLVISYAVFCLKKKKQ